MGHSEFVSSAVMSSITGEQKGSKMSFWSENYSFIKDVYDTRVCKMVEWMDHVEMAITKVMATKVYTSAEFKRERDNFLSLIKNMEKADTKKWLDEVEETLFRDRAGDERKDEYTRLEAVIEKHQGLIPRVTETQVKSEVFWKCYEYGDDLIQIFEFIDDQRAKSVRDVIIGDTEATDELIDKALAEIYKFNQDLADFDVTLTQSQEWCDGKAVEKITAIRTIPER